MTQTCVCKIFLCLASGCCAACGCLGCCCCDEANKVKLNRNVNTTTEDTEPSININERYRSLARPGSESSTATALTPVGSPLPGSRSGDDGAVASDNTAPATITTVETAAEEENVKKIPASKLESIDGVPNPSEVENDRITRTARYYFQPKYN